MTGASERSWVDTVATARERLVAPTRGGRYLAVFEPGSSRVVPLGERGELVIGRGDEAGLKLDDVKVSRRHATLVIEPHRVCVADLESQNGTFVNGERVVDRRVLGSADVIEIGRSELVVHVARSARYGEARSAIEDLCMRLAIEVERAALSARPLALLVLIIGHAEAPRAASLLAPELVGLEQLAVDGAERVVIMLPEANAADAAVRARDLAQRLSDEDVGAAGGLAVHPTDGCDADALLAGARAAASEAPAGEIREASLCVRRIALGAVEVVVADTVMLRLYALVERLAAADLPVLVTGETGTGKELVAHALHALSPRRASRLVAINCAALQDTLAESELFGHAKGAFTGAGAAKTGLLEAAAGGTAFLDEVGELSVAVQAKLLRALDTKRVVRVGEIDERAIDVRVVAATHRDLEAEVADGRFRRDLYFRLGGAALWVPPLRDRPRELSILAQRFLSEARARLGLEAMRVSDEALYALAAHAWPGNVRELKNVMEYCAAAFHEPVLEEWHVSERLCAPGPGGLPHPGGAEPPAERTHAALPADAPTVASSGFRSLEDELRELERLRIVQALEATEGNQKKAAQLIGMPLRTFVTRLTQHGLRRDK